MILVMKEYSDYCLVYVDDLLVYSATEEECVKYVSRIFDALKCAQLQSKILKCVFRMKQVDSWIA